MNTRGLTELIILSIGLGLGVLSDRTFAMMVIMALATTVMAAPIVNRLISAEEIIGNLVGGPAEAGPTPTVRVLVAIGNLLNAPALIQVAIAIAGTRRPSKLVLVKLIPSPRAPEFSSGLQGLDQQVETTTQELQPLVDQARAAGVGARVVCFVTENVGLDLARIAQNLHCAAIVLGWHRALLRAHILQALVYRTFVAAPCDVVVFVDRGGHGLTAADGRPVLAVVSGGSHDQAACTLAAHVARTLGTGVRLAGVTHAGAAPPLTEMTAELQQRSGVSVESVPVDVTAPANLQKETAAAALGVMVVGEDWLIDQPFGKPTNNLLEAAACPVLVLRGGRWLEEGSSAVPLPSTVEVPAPHGS
jgi:hypothetical protein